MSYLNRNPHLVQHERLGVYFPGSTGFLDPAWKRDANLAMDAHPSLASTPSGGIPSILTTFIDPELLRVALSPLEATQIFSEERKGSWLDQQVMFPLIERTGIVSSYGDFAESGNAGVNINWETRQVYNYQIGIEYGDMEMERAGLARISYASELREAAVWALNNYQNLTYFFGVLGLAIYGILNDPSLYPPIAPSLKAYGNNRWITGNTITATALEIYNDINALFVQLQRQSNGVIKQDDALILALSPTSASALNAVTAYTLAPVEAALKTAFKNLRIVTAIQYGAASAVNVQGNAVGEIVQLIAERPANQKTGLCAFSEKLRAFTIVRREASFRQRFMQGTEGAVIRQPWGIAQMVGV